MTAEVLVPRSEGRRRLGVIDIPVPLYGTRTRSDGTTEATNTLRITVEIEPELPALGMVHREHSYSHATTTILLREWHPQVLLHEILHIVLPYVDERMLAADDPHGHRVISPIEVGLAPFFTPPPGLAPDEVPRCQNVPSEVA